MPKSQTSAFGYINPKVLAYFPAMKLAAFVLLLSCIALTKEDTPKYSCPELDVLFDHNDLVDGGVPGVKSWENCGKNL